MLLYVTNDPRHNLFHVIKWWLRTLEYVKPCKEIGLSLLTVLMMRETHVWL